MEALKTLIAIASDVQAHAASRVSAASAFLDRAYGKSAITVGDEDGNSVFWHEILSSAQRRADTVAMVDKPPAIQ